MKINEYITKGLAISLFLFCGHWEAAAEPKSLLELEYGTYFDIDQDGKLFGSLFTSANEDKYDVSVNMGVLAVGYFNADYNIEEAVQTWQRTDFREEMLSNFNLMAYSSDWAANSPGFLTISGENVAIDKPAGDIKPYLMTISGISSFSEAYNNDDVREFGIFYDSSWGFLPEGGFFPEQYSTKGASFDQVVLGSVIEGQGLSGGDAYAAKMVPEPSTYGLIFGIVSLGVVWTHRRKRKASVTVG